jgi:hypothetical protein
LGIGYYHNLRFLGQTTESAKQAKILLQKYPASLSVLIKKNAILVLISAKLFDDALEAAQAFVRGHPTEPHAYLTELITLENQNAEAAILRSGYQTILARFPGKAEITLQYGSYLSKIGANTGSISLLEKFLARFQATRQDNHDIARIHTMLAYAYGNNCDFKLKLSHAKTVTQLDPSYAVAFSVYGHALKEQDGEKIHENTLKKANVAFEQVRMLDPSRFAIKHGAVRFKLEQVAVIEALQYQACGTFDDYLGAAKRTKSVLWSSAAVARISNEQKPIAISSTKICWQQMTAKAAPILAQSEPAETKSIKSDKFAHKGLRLSLGQFLNSSTVVSTNVNAQSSTTVGEVKSANHAI